MEGEKGGGAGEKPLAKDKWKLKLVYMDELELGSIQI
jgi:hypothetical protein